MKIRKLFRDATGRWSRQRQTVEDSPDPDRDQDLPTGYVSAEQPAGVANGATFLRETPSFPLPTRMAQPWQCRGCLAFHGHNYGHGEPLCCAMHPYGPGDVEVCSDRVVDPQPFKILCRPNLFLSDDTLRSGLLEAQLHIKMSTNMVEEANAVVVPLRVLNWLLEALDYSTFPPLRRLDLVSGAFEKTVPFLSSDETGIITVQNCVLVTAKFPLNALYSVLLTINDHPKITLS